MATKNPAEKELEGALLEARARFTKLETQLNALEGKVRSTERWRAELFPVLEDAEGDFLIGQRTEASLADARARYEEAQRDARIAAAELRAARQEHPRLQKAIARLQQQVDDAATRHYRQEYAAAVMALKAPLEEAARAYDRIKQIYAAAGRALPSTKAGLPAEPVPELLPHGVSREPARHRVLIERLENYLREVSA